MRRMVPSFGTSQFRLEKKFCEIPVLIAGEWVDFAGGLMEKLGGKMTGDYMKERDG